MNTSEFKENTFNAIFRHGNRLVGPIALATLILTILFYAILFIVFVVIFKVAVDSIGQFSDPTRFSMDPEASKAMLTEVFGSVSRMYSALFIYFILIFIAGTWVGNLMLQISDAKLRQDPAVLSTAFSKSIGKSLWRMVAALFIIVVGAWVVMLIGSLLLAMVVASGGAAFFMLYTLFLIFVFLFMLRFLATSPAIVHGNMNAYDGIKFSLKVINWRRAFYLFVIMIGVGILFMILMFILTSIGAGFGEISPYLMMPLFFLISLFMYSYATSTMSALYFRFSDFTPQEEIEHLVE